MTIEIEALELDVTIGILDFERKSKQKVIVETKINYNYTEDFFVNYVDIIGIIENLLKTNNYYLLEEAILDIGENLLSRYPKIVSLYLKISKPDIVKNGVVSVSKVWN
jgi:dihydroneopterin aldolase